MKYIRNTKPVTAWEYTPELDLKEIGADKRIVKTNKVYAFFLLPDRDVPVNYGDYIVKDDDGNFYIYEAPHFKLIYKKLL